MNLFVVPSFRCNQRCRFCLLCDNADAELPADKCGDLVRKCLQHAAVQGIEKVYVKISGGEPTLLPGALGAIIDAANAEPNAWRIGIGTNGTLRLPDVINNTRVPLRVYVSRHGVRGALPAVEWLCGDIRSELVTAWLQCTTYRGAVDSPDKVAEYLDWAERMNVCGAVFRELNDVHLDPEAFYGSRVVDYKRWADAHRVTLEELFPDLPDRSNDTYHLPSHGVMTWSWQRGRIEVMAKRTNEAELIGWNESRPNTIDEYVIHPDGLVTGCWDRRQKHLSV